MMNNTNHMNAQTIVFTDLDGTLLDHDTYSFNAALPALNALETNNIPVIINSSKTAAEIHTLRQNINIQHPFIVENGSGIYIPDDYFLHKTGEPNDSPIILGEPRDRILSIISAIQQEYGFNFIQYRQCSSEDIASMTGLCVEAASQSAQRFFTEPLQWQDSDNNKQRFIEKVQQRGLQVLQGGRFMHVMGKTNKGKANSVLAQRYGSYYQKKITTVALGDSHNDIAMLQTADIAIVIRSPHYPPPEFEHPDKIISNAYGPEGWNECIQSLFFNH